MRKTCSVSQYKMINTKITVSNRASNPHYKLAEWVDVDL